MKIKIMFIFIITLLIKTNLFGAEIYKDSIIENKTLEGDIIFTGTIYIKGRVTIPEGSSLTITEGTKLIFLFIDEEKDGIGDSEILSQGIVKISGSLKNPVIFTGEKKQKGAWLGLSIMNVDKTNIIDYAILEDSYMALHSHFSNLNINNSIFRNNFRGFQSQEGNIIIRNCEFYNNHTALQFRNSKALLENIYIGNNYGGINFLYSEAEIKNITIQSNTLFNLKIRYSKAVLNNINVQKSNQNIYSKNSEIRIENFISSHSLLRGLSFEDSIVFLSNGEISFNLLDGISLDGTKLECNKLKLNGNSRYDFYIKNKSLLTGDCLNNVEKNKIYELPVDFSSNN